MAHARVAGFVCLVVWIGFLSSTASAQKQSPTVIAARLSADGSVLTIDGSGFGASPVVTLGGFFLDGVAVNSIGTYITALAPALPPGSYQLFVQSGNNKSAAFEMTFGAEGPEGPQGPAGPEGPAGADGAQGPEGPQGPAGSQGPAGADGAQGPQGPAGMTGPAGPAGATGPAGMTGPAGPMGMSGPSGPQGVQGPAGPQGPSGVVTATAASFLGAFNGGGVGTVIEFIGPTVDVTVATGQKVYMTANKALGSTVAGGASGLNLYACFRSTVAGSSIFIQGNAMAALQVAQNTRIPFGISWVYQSLAAGTYTVGMCGAAAVPANWNFNEYGYVSALVMQ